MSASDPDAWHAVPAAEVLARVRSSPAGLDGAEAERRLAEWGRNRLTRARKRSALARFLGQFANALMLVLLGAAAVLLLIGELLDAAVVSALVVANALLGFIQEGRAQQALDAVRQSLAPEAMVIRGGRPRTIPAEELVVGDVVALASGTLVPADLRLIELHGLEVQEASLTGESMPVSKAIDPLPEETALADRSSMAWSGTMIARGAGRGVVIATGDRSEIGRIGSLLAQRDTSVTPLHRRLGRFSRRLTAAILLLAAAVYAVGEGFWDMGAVAAFRASVGVAIAAVPEALPAILTITMAVGVTRMAKRRAIIRRLPAVEALGSVDIICADKTGTITRNQLTVRTAVTSSGRFDIPPADPNPEELTVDRQSVDPLLRQLARGAAFANDAELRRESNGWAVEGDLTDGALLAFAHKCGVTNGCARRLATIPYEAEQQYMAVLDGAGDSPTIWLKGAPERVLALCSKVEMAAGFEPIDRETWTGRVEELARLGERVLAVARRPAAGDSSLDPETVASGGFTLLGLVGMIDPPRDGVAESIATARRAGIAVKMITGDHPATAKAIAASVGIEGETVAGHELDRLDEAEFGEAAAHAAIIARATPEHKQRLIAALQAQGKSIAMTGDGFNDAPALQKADIGIAMGGRGTEAAREASDIVLTDDDFTSIVAAVHEGRTVYENIRKAVAYILPTSLGEAGLIVLAVALGQALPITALQILWINLVTEATLSIAIAFDPADPQSMKRPPRPRNEPLLSRFLLWRIGFVAALMTAAGWYLFELLLATGSVDLARTAVVNGLVACEIAYLFNCRRLRQSSFGWKVLTENRVVPISIATVILLQLLFTYAGFMQQLFGSVALGWSEWAIVAGFGLLLFVVVELEKWLTRNLFSPATQS
ncbi:MAG TPA: HAD-IC family P-type ATPase [Sphingomonadaceae bacterium]|nr:HAD-IC family P-type ATPase [Sphingomonadaceae bacterium]